MGDAQDFVFSEPPKAALAAISHVQKKDRSVSCELHMRLFVWPSALCAFLWRGKCLSSAASSDGEFVRQLHRPNDFDSVQRQAETHVRMERRRIERKWHRFVFTFAIRSSANSTMRSPVIAFPGVRIGHNRQAHTDQTANGRK